MILHSTTSYPDHSRAFSETVETLERLLVMDRGRKSGYNSTGTGDSDGDTTSDDAQLVVSDSDFSSGRTKTKYAVSENDGRFSFRSLTRNERICLLIGIIALVAVVLIFIIVGVVVSAGGSSGGGENQPWMEIRLPKSITPETYTVSLDVNLKDMFAVCGTVDITASVVSETNYVIIHAKDMTISRAQVIQGEKEIKKESEFFYSENQFYVIELSQVLKVGTISIRMNYNYTLHDDLVGFYRSSYKTAAGDDHWLAVTQFEPTDARRAFPCFDEPALKANFTIQITHDASFNATSNMPPDGTPIPAEGGKVTTHFQPSVKMSTYLVAFVVSDFECVEGNVDDGRVQVRVCSNVDALDKTHYALQVAVDVISYYERFFEIEYPLPKQDLFAIPDFAAGAMENWGLITYRETAVLYDNDTDSAASKQRVAVVIAHELAHQWFGNLVTMAWWDGLWLNEGFATFMEYMGTNSTEPDFMMLDQFLVSDLAYALSEDSLLESHPILFHVSNPDEINSLFDGITYSKGGSVIRMLRHHLGEDLFQEGVNLYLEMHKYGNAETSELWDALQEVLEEAGKEEINSGLTVAEIMNTWTNQTGFPVITVTRDGDTLTLTQTRFFAVKPVNQSVIPPSPYDYKWKIPFDFITYTNHTVQKKLIKEGSVSITLPSDAGWIKANIEQQGFYRVNYDTSNWKAITDYLMKDLDSSFLTDSDRGGLLDDAFALSSAGLLDTRVALNLSYYLVSEVDYVPWRIALGWFSTFGDRLSLTSVYGKYECFVSGLLEEVVKELGFDRKDLNHLQTLLRSSVLSAAWQYGNTEVITNATALFQAWKNNHEPVDKDLKSVVYRAGIAHGTVEDWDYLWNWYEETDDPYEKRLCLGALAESTEPWVLSRYLNYSLSRVRIQDGLSVIGYISGNVHGRYLAWYYVRNNWDYIIEVYGGGSFGFSRLIRTITSAFSTELELKEVEEFFEEHPDVGSGSRAADQAIEIIRGNIAWLNTNLDSLDSYFGECPTTG